MAKLAVITSEVRIVLKILGIAAAIVLIVFLILKGGQIFKNLFFPTPLAAPEEKFGALPPISFPSQNPENIVYRINTLTGKLPTAGSAPGQIPDRMKVFPVMRAEPSLVALVTIQNRLKNIGYNQKETKVSESIYQWTNTKGSIIQYNLITNNLKVSSNFLSLPPPSKLARDTSTGAGAYQEATNFLTSVGGNISDLDPELARTSYLKIQNGALIAATSQNDAQFIRIDLFQKALDNKKVYYPGLVQSPMYFIFKDEGGFPTIADAAFEHFTAGLEESSDYPVKSAEAAYEDLARGNAFIFNPNRQSTVDITDVSLGYYVEEHDPQYFVPIFVFSGNAFTAYVPAVASSQ